MNKKFFAAAATITFALGITEPAIAADPVKFKNCSALYKEYPGGIAKNGAVDMTKKKESLFQLLQRSLHLWMMLGLQKISILIKTKMA